jgi:hypothetical protein
MNRRTAATHRRFDESRVYSSNPTNAVNLRSGCALPSARRHTHKFVPASQLSEAEKAELIARGRALVRKARERNKVVPARIIEREVRQAVAEVRGRQRR